MNKRRKRENEDVLLRHKMNQLVGYCKQCGKEIRGIDIMLGVKDGLCLECHAEHELGPEEERDARWGPEPSDEGYAEFKKRKGTTAAIH